MCNLLRLNYGGWKLFIRKKIRGDGEDKMWVGKRKKEISGKVDKIGELGRGMKISCNLKIATVSGGKPPDSHWCTIPQFEGSYVNL